MKHRKAGQRDHRHNARGWAERRRPEQARAQRGAPAPPRVKHPTQA
jgi:hypothetical protein